MHRLTDITPLRNKYFIMRHGQSEANVANLLTSDPAECISKYGLTEHGREQVTASVIVAMKKELITSDTLLFCSDFKRTVETAELVLNMLQAQGIHKSPALRERNFGEYHGTVESKYIELWPTTQQEKSVQESKGVESAESIQSRFIAFINELEAKYHDERILLISHGDPLQALQAAFAGLDPEQSRTQSYIQQAEIRELSLG